MDALHQKIISLHEKVDALYRIVEQIARQLNISFSASELGRAPARSLPHQSVPADLPSLTANPNSCLEISDSLLIEDNSARVRRESSDDRAEWSGLAHKDVLPDTQGWEQVPDYHTTEQPLSPELQIRRLTAQVTAAYSRIAALEDQLIAQRQPNGSESDASVETRWGKASRHKS
jgi:hypothetical protein